jgi:hypothetical protein
MTEERSKYAQAFAHITTHDHLEKPFLVGIKPWSADLEMDVSSHYILYILPAVIFLELG